LESVSLTEEEIAAADCVVIITGHHSLDYERVVTHARLVVDTCNATATVSEATGPSGALTQKIVRLGAPMPR
jgi:UDP-N-acetyl-D-glucosamine dehydrogenase